jgi:methanogenic corrinoid protein MtbC1/DNA-binding XRE family transcriptional regulator
MFEGMNFGRQLKKLRKAHGFRQKDLARVFRVAQSTIANYEQGIRFPDEEMLRRLADTFSVSIDYLLGRSVEGRSAYTRDDRTLKAPGSPDPRVVKFVGMVLRSDLEGAEGIVAESLKNKRGVSRVYMDLFQPALYEVGRMWETGEIDVSEEHYFSQVVQDQMARMTGKLKGGRKGPLFVGFSAGGELHDIGIRMVSDVLALHGWKSLYLGNNIPTLSIIKTIGDHKADMVGISATMTYHVNPTAALIRAIRNTDSYRPVKIIVGGRVFNIEDDLWKKVGADHYAADIGQVIADFGR